MRSDYRAQMKEDSTSYQKVMTIDSELQEQELTFFQARIQAVKSIREMNAKRRYNTKSKVIMVYVSKMGEEEVAWTMRKRNKILSKYKSMVDPSLSLSPSLSLRFTSEYTSGFILVPARLTPLNYMQQPTSASTPRRGYAVLGSFESMLAASAKCQLGI